MIANSQLAVTERFFNNAGPVSCPEHYCLDPLERIDLPEIERLIAQQRYFVLHAPRQTGKTSSLLALMYHLNVQGRYRCVYTNVEVGQAAREDVPAAMQAILSELGTWARQLAGDPYPGQVWAQMLAEVGAYDAFGELLSRWAQSSDRPIVPLTKPEIERPVELARGGQCLDRVLDLRGAVAQQPHDQRSAQVWMGGGLGGACVGGQVRAAQAGAQDQITVPPDWPDAPDLHKPDTAVTRCR